MTPTLAKAAHEQATAWVRRRVAKLSPAAQSFLYADPAYQGLEEAADRVAQSGDVEATKIACRRLMAWVQVRTASSTPQDRPGGHV